MTSSHVYHHAKFRWTENLTCRFIQLRKEHGKMFTGRKYSAQAGWEYILRQMREEFPTIMADVHYRVLKKKWSNLLQQYKELKNPVHGDKNKADDISWPFYAAIDEVLGGFSPSLPPPSHHPRSDDEDDEDELNPQEFLCVSVDNHDDEEDENNEEATIAVDQLRDVYRGKVPGLQPLRRGHVFDVERTPRATRRSTTTSTSTTARKRIADDTSSSSSLLSRLPRATELTIRPIRRNASTTGPFGSSCPGPSDLLPPPALEPIASANGRSTASGEQRSETPTRGVKLELEEPRDESPRKRRREEGEGESRLERRIGEFLEYAKKRDEENRSILMRMLQAVEDIRNAVR